jgi:hypothetical protein
MKTSKLLINLRIRTEFFHGWLLSFIISTTIRCLNVFFGPWSLVWLNAWPMIKCCSFDDNFFRCYPLNSISARRLNPKTSNQNKAGFYPSKESQADDSEGNIMIESLSWFISHGMCNSLRIEKSWSHMQCLLILRKKIGSLKSQSGYQKA